MHKAYGTYVAACLVVNKEIISNIIFIKISWLGHLIGQRKSTLFCKQRLVGFDGFTIASCALTLSYTSTTLAKVVSIMLREFCFFEFVKYLTTLCVSLNRTYILIREF